MSFIRSAIMMALVCCLSMCTPCPAQPTGNFLPTGNNLPVGVVATDYGFQGSLLYNCLFFEPQHPQLWVICVSVGPGKPRPTAKHVPLGRACCGSPENEHLWVICGSVGLQENKLPKRLKNELWDAGGVNFYQLPTCNFLPVGWRLIWA